MANIDIDTEIIKGIIAREGGYVNNPTDKGGPTAYGISKTSNPDAWKNGPPTEAEARAIYLQRYVVGPGFDEIGDIQLRTQLVDFGVNSGPAVAIKHLQAVVGTTVDGVLGPETVAAITAATNNLLVAARVKMIGQIVTHTPSQLTFLNGW